MSLSILLLTAIAGMAVDLGNWYFNADRLQKTADAASLSGAPYLPGNPTAAFAAATETLRQNGIDPSLVSTSTPVTRTGPNVYSAHVYLSQDPQYPSRLRVQAGVKVHNILLGLIGVKDVWMLRDANGQYRQAVQMGSPGNVLGAEPLQSGQLSVQSTNAQANAGTKNSSYWLNIAGTKSDKASGDRYSAGVCSGSTDGCNANGTNAELTQVSGLNSHQYIVHIPASLNGETFTLQAYDAAFVDVGDHCDTGYGPQLGSAQLNAYATNTLHQDAAAYAGGTGSFCTGDYSQGNGGAAPTLKFTVQKADTQQNPSGSPVAPVKSFPGYNFSSGTSLVQHLQSDSALAKSFRRWADVATISQAGDYVVTASTPAGAGGANRFSLRLGVGQSDSSDNGKGYWDANSADKVSVYAKGALAVYTNAKAADTSFYFAKLTDSAAGRDLTIELFDIGDVPSGESVDLQLLSPTQPNSGAPAFTGCQIQDPVSKQFYPSYNCEIDGATSALYNGKVIKMNVKVAPGYQCTDDGTSKCWMSLRFNLHGNDPATGAPIVANTPSTDTTTWQIDDCGNPVKLLKDNSPDDGSCPSAGA